MKTKSNLIEGLIVRAHGRTVYARLENEHEEKICYIRQSLRRSSEALNPVAVGDRVYIQLEENDERGVVVDLVSRKNKLSRRASSEWGGREQILAANLDQIIVVVAARQPDPNINKIDRLLVITEACEIPAVLCFNKIDLENEDIQNIIKIYENAGYPCLTISAITGQNMEQLKELLKDKLSILFGSSGVGKSTILNVLQPDLSVRVRETSEKTGKGKHTTTNAQMFDLSFGGAIVDTPGLKELSIWGVDQIGLSLCYPEFVPHLDDCYFDDCIHVTEPNCAVKAALEKKQIHPLRYQSYCRILETL